MKKQLLIIPSIIFLSILSIFFYLLTIERDPSDLPSVLLDKNVPKFEAESLLSDEKFISQRKFGNEIILVNFFATWCKPCRDEHVYIERFSKEENINIIGSIVEVFHYPTTFKVVISNTQRITNIIQGAGYNKSMSGQVPASYGGANKLDLERKVLSKVLNIV